VLSSTLSREVKSPAGGNRRLTPLQIQAVNPLSGTTPAGDNENRDASFFQGAAWARVLTETYGYTPVYFQAVRDNRVEAVLPVMEVESRLTGRRGVSLPFTDHCEPVGASPAVLKSVFQEAVRHGRARRWKYLECRGGGSLFVGATPSLSFFSHQLRLLPDLDYLFSRFESSVRRAIRKAERAGLKVEFARDLPAVQTYYALHCQTRREHGLPPQPFRFFREIQRHILEAGLGCVVSARQRSRALASAIFFFQGDEAIYKFGASDPGQRELRANNLVMWEAIRWLAGRGVKNLDFGRTSLANAGLRRYKLGWGGEEHTLDYFKYDLRRDEFVLDHDAAFGWHNRLFQHLPVALARVAGEILYRHWA